jgi:hypothetical protein
LRFKLTSTALFSIKTQLLSIGQDLNPWPNDPEVFGDDNFATPEGSFLEAGKAVT